MSALYQDLKTQLEYFYHWEKTTKGKFIVPTVLEDKFSENELIEQICVVGLGISQPMALVNLSEIGLAAPKEEVTARLQQELKEVNTHLHGHEVMSSLVIIEEAWSPDNQLLTPTLKVRRGALDEQYMSQYPAWHEGKEKIIWNRM